MLLESVGLLGEQIQKEKGWEQMLWMREAKKKKNLWGEGLEKVPSVRVYGK